MLKEIVELVALFMGLLIMLILIEAAVKARLRK